MCSITADQAKQLQKQINCAQSVLNQWNQFISSQQQENNTEAPENEQKAVNMTEYSCRCGSKCPEIIYKDLLCMLRNSKKHHHEELLKEVKILCENY